jgi:hypothetical protein
VPTQARWYPAFRSELLSFPAGKHDQVDAMGLIGQLLNRMGPGRELPPPKKEEPMLTIGSITVDQWSVFPAAVNFVSTYFGVHASKATLLRLSK